MRFKCTALEKTPTIYRVVTSQKLRRPLVAAVLLTVTQQMSGIDAVFYYSGEFFEVSFFISTMYASQLSNVPHVVFTASWNFRRCWYFNGFCNQHYFHGCWSIFNGENW